MEASRKNVVYLRELFIGPLRPGEQVWGTKEVDQAELMELTKDKRFIGYGDPSGNATMLVKYASFSREVEFIPGFGSFA